jgi:K+ transporter
LALLAIGVVTVRNTRNVVEVPYAAIPLLFAMQQLIEGGLWHQLPVQSCTTNALTIGYLLFSNVLWPVYVPVAVWLLEPRAARRRKIAWTVASGTAVSIFFLVAIITQPVTAAIEGMHIIYHIPHHHDAIAVAVYATATCLAPLLSSHKMVQLFGISLVGSMIVASILYFHWFASVWCFFAAILSCLVLLHFTSSREPSRRLPTSTRN